MSTLDVSRARDIDGYPCGWPGCGQVLRSPGSLGGHMSWHRRRGGGPVGGLVVRGKQSLDALKLSHDRKVSPHATWQESRKRWIPTIPSSFGLPAGVTCPGRTEFCSSCYAENSERSSGVLDLVQHNHRLLVQAGTVDAMISLLDDMIGRYVAHADRRGLGVADRVFRIHWDGDFYSIDYAQAWANVIARHPDVAFWAYTRSFTAPVDVVPVLDSLANLALYLSVDEHNVTAALDALARHPSVRLAWCTVDYNHARQLQRDSGARAALICPENAERMPIMSDTGRGACVDCRLCVDGRQDVIFSTSHRHDANERVAVRVTFRGARCKGPGCNKPLAPSGRGRPIEFCSDSCRWKASRQQSGAKMSKAADRIVAWLGVNGPLEDADGAVIQRLGGLLDMSYRTAWAAIDELHKRGVIVRVTASRRTTSVGLAVVDVAAAVVEHAKTTSIGRVVEGCTFCERSAPDPCTMHRPPRAALLGVVPPMSETIEQTVVELPNSSKPVSASTDCDDDEHDQLIDYMGRYAALVDELAACKAQMLRDRELIGNLRAQRDRLMGRAQAS